MNTTAELNRMQRALEESSTELVRASTMFSSFASAHEGYAVLLEEVEELWTEIKTNPAKDLERDARMHAEAVQVAAMALRFLVDVCYKESV